MKKVYIVGNSMTAQDSRLLMAIAIRFGCGQVDIESIEPAAVRQLIDGDEPQIREIEDLIFDPSYVSFADAIRVAHSCGIHVDNPSTEYFATNVWIYQDGNIEHL